MAEARDSGRLVFVEFAASWCPPCRKMAKDTLRNDEVVDELAELLCIALDVDEGEGRTLKERYNVVTLPTFLFLEPDGETRDRFDGYYAPPLFAKELRRVKRDEGTLSGLRRRIAEDGSDLDARLDLALKLRKLGDEAGYEEQVAAILDQDPDGTSEVMLRLRREQRLAELDTLVTAAKQDLRLETLYDFLAAERDPELLYYGWYHAWTIEGQLVQSAREDGARETHRRRWIEAARSLWKNIPEKYVAGVGNYVAWECWVNRASLGADDLAFALRVAERAAAAAPQEPAVIDTLACCQFAVGRVDEAIATIQRCIAMDPRNEQWRERLELFRR
jgi:thiol-disulfide isomerase/thioredoxin